MRFLRFPAILSIFCGFLRIQADKGAPRDRKHRPLSAIIDGVEEQPWSQDVAGLGRPRQDFLRPGGERRSRLRGRGVLKFRKVYLKFSERWSPTPR